MKVSLINKILTTALCITAGSINAEEADVTRIDRVGVSLYECSGENNTYRGWVGVNAPVAGNCKYFTFDAGNNIGKNALKIGIESKTWRQPVRITYTTEQDACVGSNTVCRLRAIELQP